MRTSSQAILRRPFDTTIAEGMTTALADFAKKNRLTEIPKDVGRCSLSILSVPQINTARRRSKGPFNMAVFTGELLDATGGSPLRAMTGKISQIKFGRTRDEGVRLMAFIASAGLENEAKTAYGLLSEEKLTRYRYLPGVHMSFGAIFGQAGKKTLHNFLDTLSEEYVGTEIKLRPAVLREYRGYQPVYTSLADIATNSIATQLELRRENSLAIESEISFWR